MEKLMVSDQYQIKADLPLANRDLQVLTKLYLPIISKNAFTLYMAMYGEADTHRILNNLVSPISRLKKITDLTQDQLEEAMNTLEGIGLISTYVKYEDINHYIFELHLPLNAEKFFQNQVYHVLLYRTLGKEDYEKTKYYFLGRPIDMEQYEDVSASFKDAFYINLDSMEGGEVLKRKSSIRNMTSKEVEVDYNLDAFYKELSMLQVRKDILSKEDIKTISQLGMIYSIPGIQLANLVVESIENQHLNTKMLSVKARNYYDLDSHASLQAVYRSQPMQYRVNYTGNDDRSKHLHQLETWSPYKLIEKKQQSEPTRRDLTIVENLMVKLGLNAGVVNVLLELTWAQNDGRMSRNYMEAIGATWQRKGIKTVSEAMEESKKYLKAKNSQSKEPDWVKTRKIDQMANEKTEDKQEEYDDAYIQDLLSKVGE